MFDPSKTRSAANVIRGMNEDATRRDARLTSLMGEAMVALRQMSGGVTREQLVRDCGFTADEVTRLGSAATDFAAEQWHGHDLLEPAA